MEQMEETIKGQPGNPGSPGNWSLKFLRVLASPAMGHCGTCPHPTSNNLFFFQLTLELHNKI